MGVRIEEAMRIVAEAAGRLPCETVPLEEAVGRVCGRTLHARVSLPPFDNSAMDGYGIRGVHTRYRIADRVLAGDAHRVDLSDGEAVRIMTGAQLPEGVERVVPQERVRIEGGSIAVEAELPMGANIRRLGEDIMKGEAVLREGEEITSAHIGLLASQGITHLSVHTRPIVALFATGSELKLHYEEIAQAQIYNSNTPYLIARCTELGAQTRFLGRSEDSVASLKQLIEASLGADLIVTSGGVSVGEADFTKEAFGALGFEPLFEGVAIKPGKPTTFGRIGRTLVLNLPGNPLAAALNFELFGKTAIRALRGCNATYPKVMQVPCGEEIVSKRAVDSVIPGRYDGRHFMPAPKFAPGMVNVLPHCNGMIIVGGETERIGRGDPVGFLPIRWEFAGEAPAAFRS